MTITLETAENTVKWGNAGFGLLSAIISMVGLIANAKNGQSIKGKPEE